MEEFETKYFAIELKKIAKNDYGGVGKLAESLGMKQPNLSQYLSGNIEPRAGLLFRLAKLNIDVNKLLTGDSYMNKDGEAQFRSMIENLQKQIDEINKDKENEINKWKAVAFDYKTSRDELELENNQLRANYNRVAEVNAKYSAIKLKKGGGRD